MERTDQMKVVGITEHDPRASSPLLLVQLGRVDGKPGGMQLYVPAEEAAEYAVAMTTGITFDNTLKSTPKA